MKDELQYNFGILDSFLNLKYNWNGNGAGRFSKPYIELVKSLVRDLPYQPEIFPTARDSVLLEYEKDGKEFLSFEIRKNGRIDMFEVFDDDTSIEVKINKENMIEKIDQFYK
jgi:hypothetical protein